MIRSYNLDSDTVKKLHAIYNFLKSNGNSSFSITYSSVIRYAINELYKKIFVG